MKFKHLVLALLAMSLLAVLAPGAALAQPVRPAGATALSTAPRSQWNVDLVGQLGGWIKSVAVQDGITYVGVGPRLFVFDTLDPSDPDLLVQSEVLASTIHGLAVSGRYAYLVGRQLHILDVSNPEAPVEVGSLNAVDGGDIVVLDSLAYIASMQGLKIVDVTDPAEPALLATGSTSGEEAQGVAVSEGYAYVTTSGGRLLAFNLADLPLLSPSLADPPSLEPVGALDGLGQADEVAVSGAYAYVAAQMDGLHIVDVSDPETPSLVTTVTQDATPAIDVVVDGGTAYLSLLWNDLAVVDVSDPAAPTVTPYDPSLHSAHALVVAGGYAYVVGGGGLAVWDLATPGPAAVGRYEMPGGNMTLSVAGDMAYIGGDMFGGVYMVDVSDPAHPDWVGVYDNVRSAAAAHAVQDARAYLVEDGALRILDVSDAANPVETHYLGGLGGGQDIVLAGGLAYIAEAPRCDWDGSDCQYVGGGLRIVDVTTQGAPLQVGYLDTPADVRGVTVVGDRAYIAAHEDGLSVVDISNPELPVVLGSYDTPGEAKAVSVVGDLAYVASGGAGLVVVDVSDPASPVPVTQIPWGQANDVVMVGTQAYVAFGWALVILDLSDLETPRVVGFYETEDADLVALANGLIYVVSQGGGLFILRYVPVTVDMDPDSLNLKSKSKWVTAYLELPDGYGPAAIDVATLQIDGVIQAETRPVSVGDADRDGVPDLMVKFDRQALISYLDGTTGEVTLTVSGQLVGGTLFEAKDTISVH